MNRWISGAIAAALALAFAGTASASIIFTDFSSTAGLTLNGNAATVGPVLRLAPSSIGQRGSAFTSSPVGISSFSSVFTFQITNPGGATDGFGQTGADGLTFTLQSSPAGAGALGAGGGSLGYGGISPSVAVEFDTWFNGAALDTSSNDLGVNTNGNLASLQTAALAPQFDNGAIWTAWVDYDGITLEVRTNTTGLRPAAPTLAQIIDILTTLGTSTAFVGFTAATGAAFGDHDILSWRYDVPEPTALALLGLGLVALSFTKRQSR
ncbi:MAG: L-type lectin-domain containing protein [Acidiferrobacterales bacterium]|nr:L-type lectin-domain containing protein [Acidiferrobacterales bacterium]